MDVTVGYEWKLKDGKVLLKLTLPEGRKVDLFFPLLKAREIGKWLMAVTPKTTDASDQIARDIIAEAMKEEE